MEKPPRVIIIIILLLIALSSILTIWGHFAGSILIQIPGWQYDMETPFAATIFWVFLIGTIVFLGSSVLMLILIYGIIKRTRWVWTVLIILNSLALFVFGVMLAAFIVTVLIFKDIFSVTGIETSVLALLTDILIIYFLMKPEVKDYLVAE